MAHLRDFTSPYVASSAVTLGEDQAMTLYLKMIHDIHTHHHPDIPGTAIVQLVPDAFVLLPKHYYSIGLHPWNIGEKWETQMAKAAVIALHPQVLMIGETGLDKQKGNAPIELQMAIFREHIRLSELLHKPLIIHCVKAIDEILAIRKETKATQPWILHGFRGGIEQWRQLSHAGIYVSLGERYNTELIKQLPKQYLLIESDEATEIDSIYEHISHDTSIPTLELKQTVESNILHLFEHSLAQSKSSQKEAQD